jgi:hypothetical protein
MKRSLVQLGLRGLHNHQVSRVRKKPAWGIFGGHGTGVVVPSPISATSSSFTSFVSEFSVYLDSENITSYEDGFDILFWWHEHKLIYPILSIMAQDHYYKTKIL